MMLRMRTVCTMMRRWCGDDDGDGGDDGDGVVMMMMIVMIVMIVMNGWSGKM